MYSAQGIFQHNFQCKKVRTILDKIQYILALRIFWWNWLIFNFILYFYFSKHSWHLCGNYCQYFLSLWSAQKEFKTFSIKLLNISQLHFIKLFYTFECFTTKRPTSNYFTVIHLECSLAYKYYTRPLMLVKHKTVSYSQIDLLKAIFKTFYFLHNLQMVPIS